jgi:hypothetical protein
MASPEDVAAAFDRVDALLVAAKETAPSVALLLDRAAANGICEKTLANHLHLNATVLKWVMRTGPDATTDRSLDLEAADDDLAELVLRWARS